MNRFHTEEDEGMSEETTRFSERGMLALSGPPSSDQKQLLSQLRWRLKVYGEHKWRTISTTVVKNEFPDPEELPVIIYYSLNIFKMIYPKSPVAVKIKYSCQITTSVRERSQIEFTLGLNCSLSNFPKILNLLIP